MNSISHMHFPRIFILLVFILSFSCKEHNTKAQHELPIPNVEVENVSLDYAEGFSITVNEGFKVLTINNAWPDSDKTYTYALVDRDMLPKITLNKDEFDGIIATPVQKIVVTSTTHIPALELLEVEQSLIGFPGTDYISSEKTRVQIDNGSVSELGKNEGINTEVLLELQPELIVTFGVDGTNKSLATIETSGIPILYNGDWVEKSPLAKAEWIKFFGALYNKQQQADAIFNEIKTNYEDAKKLASKIDQKPAVLCGAMYKDIWYLPSGTSPEAQFLKDANVNYLWSETTGKGSLALSFEAVFEKGKNADLWLSPSYYTSLDAIKKANSHYTQFEAFKNKQVYSFANTTGATGGVLYYELGTARPDLVLKDMIKICHPELLGDYNLTFFENME